MGVMIPFYIYPDRHNSSWSFNFVFPWFWSQSNFFSANFWPLVQTLSSSQWIRVWWVSRCRKLPYNPIMHVAGTWHKNLYSMYKKSQKKSPVSKSSALLWILQSHCTVVLVDMEQCQEMYEDRKRCVVFASPCTPTESETQVWDLTIGLTTRSVCHLNQGSFTCLSSVEKAPKFMRDNGGLLSNKKRNDSSLCQKWLQ